MTDTLSKSLYVVAILAGIGLTVAGCNEAETWACSCSMVCADGAEVDWTFDNVCLDPDSVDGAVNELESYCSSDPNDECAGDDAATCECECTSIGDVC